MDQTPNQFQEESWEPESRKKQESLVRLIKPIIVNPDAPRGIDPSVVSSRFYNAFNYSLLSREQGNVRFAVGIASANKGEGKTLVASNLAVSLALATQRETIVVDLNFRSPRQHRVFGTKLNPGLAESFQDTAIRVSKSNIEFLYVLPTGDPGSLAAEIFRDSEVPTSPDTRNSSVSLEHAAAFRDVVYSLKEEFEFVIVDMPAVNDRSFPLLLTRHLDGILVVVDSNRTRHEDIQKIFQRFSDSNIHGFILNRTQEHVYS